MIRNIHNLVLKLLCIISLHFLCFLELQSIRQEGDDILIKAGCVSSFYILIVQSYLHEIGRNHNWLLHLYPRSTEKRKSHSKNRFVAKNFQYFFDYTYLPKIKN